MREASKTRAIRSADFYTAYLGGKVLEIGLYRKPANPSRVRHLKLKVFTAGRRWIRRAGLANTFAERIFITMALVTRSPVDQTLGNALAQIEVVAHKEARRA
jgi:hypothetical protein